MVSDDVMVFPLADHRILFSFQVRPEQARWLPLSRALNNLSACQTSTKCKLSQQSSAWELHETNEFCSASLFICSAKASSEASGEAMPVVGNPIGPSDRKALIIVIYQLVDCPYT